MPTQPANAPPTPSGTIVKIRQTKDKPTMFLSKPLQTTIINPYRDSVNKKLKDVSCKYRTYVKLSSPSPLQTLPTTKNKKPCKVSSPSWRNCGTSTVNSQRSHGKMKLTSLFDNPRHFPLPDPPWNDLSTAYGFNAPAQLIVVCS